MPRARFWVSSAAGTSRQPAEFWPAHSGKKSREPEAAALARREPSQQRPGGIQVLKPRNGRERKPEFGAAGVLILWRPIHDFMPRGIFVLSFKNRTDTLF